MWNAAAFMSNDIWSRSSFIHGSLHIAQWLILLTGYQEPKTGWMPPAQFISPDTGREMTEKHQRHYSSVFISLIFKLFLIIMMQFIIRPHRSTTYVDAAYSYRPSIVVCRSVCHTSEPCKNGCTDRAAVWVEDLGGPGEPCIRWGSKSPHGKGQIFGGEWASHCKV